MLCMKLHNVERRRERRYLDFDSFYIIIEMEGLQFQNLLICMELPEAPVLPLHYICHGYSLLGHRKMIQQKLVFLISMLQGLIFIFRAVHSFRNIVIVSMDHSWKLSCPAEDTPSPKSQLSCSCVSDALLASQPIRLLQENVSHVTYCSWTLNFELSAAIKCKTILFIFSPDGSVLYIQQINDSKVVC